MLMIAVTIAAMLEDDRYWPPPCHGDICTMTGLGGIVSVWVEHVERNRDKTFVVRGTCASACNIAVQHAIRSGFAVIMFPGSRLIKHNPSPAKWF